MLPSNTNSHSYMSDTPGKARGYCRVSTQYQSEDGISLDTQKKRIQDHCLYKKYELIQIYCDSGISGKNMARPGLQSLINDVQPGEYIIIPDLSRLSRNTSDALRMFEYFESKGVFFICLSPDIDFSTPVGKLIFTVLMAVHHLERQNISMHVSNNMRMLSREGKLRSRPPFGYKFVGKNRNFEPEPEQQRVIEKIKQLYASGMKYASIARKLNEDGDNKCLNNNKKNPRDNPRFYAETVKTILIDAGLVEDPKGKRVPIEKRIVSHRNNSESRYII